MDNDLNDDLVKLVRYRLLWIGRGHEAELYSGERLLNERLSQTDFAVRTTAEFITAVSTGALDVPKAWLTDPPPGMRADKHSKLLNLPPEGAKNIRVHFDVLVRYRKEDIQFDARRVDVLKRVAAPINASTPEAQKKGQG